MTGDWWVAAVVLLQSAACLSYAVCADYRQAGIWLFAALSNAFYLSMARG